MGNNPISFGDNRRNDIVNNTLQIPERKQLKWFLEEEHPNFENFDSPNKISNEILFYKKAIQIKPYDALLYHYLGMAYFEQEEKSKAIFFIEKAVEIDPIAMIYENDAYHYLGDIYKTIKEYTKAIEFYKKAIEIDPKDSEAYNKLGILYSEQKQYSKAIESLKKVIEINPNNSNSYNKLGIVFCEQKQFSKAIKYYKKAIKINPKDSFAYYSHGYIYCEQKKYLKAKKFFKKAISLEKKDVYLRSLEFVFFITKEYSEAISFFTKHGKTEYVKNFKKWKKIV